MRNHLRKFIEYVKIDNSYLLLLFSFFIGLFPGSGVDLGRMMPQVINRIKWKTNMNIVLTSMTTVSVFIYIIVRTRRGKIFAPNLIFAGFMLGILAYLGIYCSWLSTNQQAIYWAISAAAMVFNIMIALGIIACAYQILQYSEDGYESFTINSITGITNFGVVLSNAIGSGVLSPFMDKRRYTNRSVGFVCAFCIEYAMILLLLSIQFLLLKRNKINRKSSNSIEQHESVKSTSRQAITTP